MGDPKTFRQMEIKDRFKPVKVVLQAWPAGSSVSQILEENRGENGDSTFIVKMKDRQVVKVSKENLSKNHTDLITRFKKQTSRNDLPTKRRAQQKYQQQSKKPRNLGRTRKDPVINQSESENESEEIEEVADSTDEEYSEASSDPPEQSSTTQRGRQSNKPKSYLTEFYSKVFNEPPPRTKTGPSLKIPLYEDEAFIEHHSDYCFKCHKGGHINGKNNNTEYVHIGSGNDRTRLLLCCHCSLSAHNNCVALQKTTFDRTTGEYKCRKCLKSTECTVCKLPTKKGDLPLRCYNCFRCMHEGCILAGASPGSKESYDESMIPDIYESGLCIDCSEFDDKKVESILSERVVDGKREFFIKWVGLSFRKTEWVSADWILHAYNSSYNGYLQRKENGKIMPYSEEWTMIDRILDVEWENKQMKAPKRVLAVFKDRDYNEACWDEPPSKEETALYAEYKAALKRYVQATNVVPPKNTKMLINQVRSKATSESYEKHELKKQPKFIAGGTLMKHQMEALNWLLYQWEKSQSCILADDMGLGKTIQIITFLYYLFKKYNIYPFYIVVPNSTATNWIREFQKWGPEMTVAPYFGRGTSRQIALDHEVFDSKGRLKCHVVVATYETALETTLSSVFWPVMVVDESQRLKNDNSLLFKQLKRLRVDHTVLLTGTPLQNNLRELFNIMNFIHPDAFQGHEAENYEELTTSQVEELHSRLRPFFLRRTKEEVLKTLPPRYELIVPLSMTTLQKEVYKQCLSGEIQETLAQVTMTKRQQGLTNIFVNLRKVLNHPYLLDGVETPQASAEIVQKNMIEACAKLKLFHQMLPKLIERGHRMLIFSTMTRTLDILEDYFYYEKIKYARLDGSTSERDRVRRIDAFNAPNSKLNVFLLSTRAGGVGINLATADTVIIWDSDFNPYADLQAIGRAHRIGQTKMVLIYRLMTRYSVEEKVLQIAKKRIALEHVVVEKMKDKEDVDLEDVEAILKYGTEALFSDDTSKDIVYDSSAIENLLDREQYRETATEQQQKEVEELEGQANDKGAMNFSFAKIWKSDGTSEELAEDTNEDDNKKDADFWEQFLLEQQAALEKKKEERRLAELNYGRGARKRTAVHYNEVELGREQMSKDDAKKGKQKTDDLDFDFVAEPNASDSAGEELEDMTATAGDSANLTGKVPRPQMEDKENAPGNLQTNTHHHQEAQSVPVVPVTQTPKQSSSSKQADKIHHNHVREMERILKYYADTMYTTLTSFIEKDIKHIQNQAEQSVHKHTFSMEKFRESRPSLVGHIQNSIVQFSLNTAERERQADLNNGIDPHLVNYTFDRKKAIINMETIRTTDFILQRFDMVEKYIRDIMRHIEAQGRLQFEKLKSEITKLRHLEESVKLKHKLVEKDLASKHKRHIMALANMFNIYPEGIQPGQTINIDEAADKLIDIVLKSDSQSTPVPSSSQSNIVNNTQSNTVNTNTRSIPAVITPSSPAANTLSVIIQPNTTRPQNMNVDTDNGTPLNSDQVRRVQLLHPNNI